MDLSVCAYSFEALPLEGALGICQSMGFKSVAISGFANRGRSSYDPDEVGINPQKAADNLMRLLDKYGLHAVDFFVQFSSSFYGRSMNEPDLAVRDKNVKMFGGIARFCQLVKIPVVTLLPGMEHPGATYEQNLDIAGETFRKVLKIAGEASLRLCFEPHTESLTSTPERALSLIERAPGLKVALDYSHFVFQYIDVERIHKLIPCAAYFHVRPTRPGRLQTRHSEGTIDFVDIINRLKAVNYDGSMSIEYVCSPWYDANQLDTITETMATKAALEPYVSVA